MVAVMPALLYPHHAIRGERVVQIQASTGEENWDIHPQHGSKNSSGGSTTFGELDSSETYEISIPAVANDAPEANG